MRPPPIVAPHQPRLDWQVSHYRCLVAIECWLIWDRCGSRLSQTSITTRGSGIFCASSWRIAPMSPRFSSTTRFFTLLQLSSGKYSLVFIFSQVSCDPLKGDEIRLHVYELEQHGLVESKVFGRLYAVRVISRQSPRAGIPSTQRLAGVVACQISLSQCKKKKKNRSCSDYQERTDAIRRSLLFSLRTRSYTAR